MRIAIQGDQGSYHHIAARAYFGKDIELLCCKTFADTFAALGHGDVDKAVVAVENSIVGTVHSTYDLLLTHHFSVTGEIYEHIHHCLIGFPGVKVDEITRVYSHPMALPQCSTYLDTYLPGAERIEYNDTAAGVEHIKELNDPHYAAIASNLAAGIYELPILKANIENYQNNVTRFLVLEKQSEAPIGSNKASIVLETNHEPGGLYKALGVFADAGLNLTKLESRPIAHEPWHYQFLVDIEITKDELIQCTKRLGSQGCTVRLLGEYKAATTTI